MPGGLLGRHGVRHGPLGILSHSGRRDRGGRRRRRPRRQFALPRHDECRRRRRHPETESVQAQVVLMWPLESRSTTPRSQAVWARADETNETGDRLLACGAIGAQGDRRHAVKASDLDDLGVEDGLGHSGARAGD